MKKIMINTDLIYPIGSIYMSVNDTNPSNIFGGVWEQIKDTFLLACGDKYLNGLTGGEEKHKLTIDEIPNHSHQMEYNGTQINSDQATSGWYPGYQIAMSEKWSADMPYWYTKATGGGQSHNNMPPYLAVYIWKRVS